MKIIACLVFGFSFILLCWAAPPAIPVPLPATSIESDSFVANWSLVANADGYDLEVREGLSSIVLNTSFEGSTSFPAGWVASGAIVYNYPTLAVEGANLVVMDTANEYVNTPVLTSPEKIKFWMRASGSTSNFTVKVQSSTDQSSWTTHATLRANGSNTGDIINTYREFTFTPSLEGNHYLRWMMESRTTGNVYMDVVTIEGGLGTALEDFYPYQTTSASAQVGSLAQATIYSYRVRAYNLDGYSLYSDWVSTETTDVTLPVQLTSFTAAQISMDKVRLRWTTESETCLSGYRILRAEYPDLEEARAICPLIQANNSSQQSQYYFDDHELTDPGTYYYWLEATEIDGVTETFGPIALNYNPIADAEHTPPLLDGFTRVYPNPFEGTVLMKFKAPMLEKASLTIHNLKGQQIRDYNVISSGDEEHTLQWDGLNDVGSPCPSGIYWAILQIGKTKHVRKLTLSK